MLAHESKAVRAFLEELGLYTAHAAGNSMGGWISLELGLLGTARSVTALSLVAATILEGSA